MRTKLMPFNLYIPQNLFLATTFLFLFFIAPIPVSPALAGDLNIDGKWADQNNRIVKIWHKNSIIYMKTASDLVFEGRLTKDIIELSADYGKSLRWDLRGKLPLEAATIRFKGKVTNKGKTINGELITPRYNEKTFKVVDPETEVIILTKITPAKKTVGPPQLPKNGVIPYQDEWAKSVVFATTKNQKYLRWKMMNSECSCKTIAIGRITTTVKHGARRINNYQYSKSKWVTKTVYNWNKSSPYPVNLKFPTLRNPGSYKRTEKVCFYFTFPKYLALLDSLGGRKQPCRVIVNTKYPFTHIQGGYVTRKDQLYSLKGSAPSVLTGGLDTRQLVQNNICIYTLNKVAQIGPAGKSGYIKWNVRSPGLISLVKKKSSNKPLIDKPHGNEDCKIVKFKFIKK